MRIGNPPPLVQATIGISSILSPSVFTTGAQITVTNGSTQDVAAAPSQYELFLTNTHTTSSVYIRDTAATTQAVGTLLAPLQTIVLKTTAAIRITNNSGVSVVININTSRWS